MDAVLSRWVVQQEHVIEPGDLDSDGVLNDAVVEAVVRSAWSEYLGRCLILGELGQRPGSIISLRTGRLPPGALFGRRPSTLLVTGGVSEIRPSSLTASFRLRPLGGTGETPVTARATVVVTDSRGEPVLLGDAVRDELIAVEHAARHLN